MSMENIPKIENNQIKDEFQSFREVIASGSVQQWIDAEMEALKEANPVLCEFITDRANRFAMGAVMVGDPKSVAMSLAIEYVLLLHILNAGFGSMKTLEDFDTKMTKWFPDGLSMDGFSDDKK